VFLIQVPILIKVGLQGLIPRRLQRPKSGNFDFRNKNRFVTVLISLIGDWWISFFTAVTIQPFHKSRRDLRVQHYIMLTTS
jgi:hypothetical protein